MSVDGIANLFQNLPGQLPGQTQEIRTAKGASGTVNPVVTEDIFTPSTQNPLAPLTEQDAGIFQVSPAALTAAAANLLFPPSASNTDQWGAAVQATNAGAPQAAAATNTGSAGNAGQPAANTPAAQANLGAAAAATVQLQIQALNAALPSLGLTNNQVNEIDRIASLVQNFNPAAYANLVSQFEALAQQAAPPNTVNLPVIPGTSPATNSGTGASGSGFQVQEVLLKFTGAPQAAAGNTAGNGNGQSAPANTPPTAGPALEIGQVVFTLTNANGQTVQVQSPQQNSNG
jgi:hypothetical protein